MTDHSQNIALVTGAGSGIGRASAELFAKHGAKVAIADIDLESAKDTLRRIEAAGGEGIAIHVDVGDERSVEAMIDRTVSHYGRLDCAHNNAGISQDTRPFHEVTTEMWDRMILINLTSVFWCMKYEIARMLEQEPRDGQRGAIVNTSSGAAIVPAPGQPQYTAAKHGVVGLTKNAAQEYFPQGIRSNAILPGLTNTAMMQRSLETSSPEIIAQMRASIPGGEPGDPADVAAAAVWMCSPEARWINGQSVLTDAGGVLR
ncbi:MAG: SDR family oxidoreductase [Deltaproteobacteria bacterium]|nr:SDR family oxidoreductase [Deltaproteobacteria bacterium]MBW2497636.1 SDR family oxidoreductase [Deltaproteobacteria bacterium]